MTRTITRPPTDTFRLDVVAAGLGAVDRDNHVIHGAALMQTGDVRDSRPWFADETTLEQGEQLMLEMAPRGLKARVTHPNMSNDGFGTYAGRWRNPRIDGTTLRADLHIADIAFKTKGPASEESNLGEYLMDLAEEDPEAFGVSFAPKALNYKDMESGETDDGRQPIRFEALLAADIVDEPAATHRGFFSADVRQLPAQATLLMDTYFGKAEESVVRARVAGFLDKYFGKAEPQPPTTKAKRMMKITFSNRTGNLQQVNDAGEVVATHHISDLKLTTTEVSEHFATQVAELNKDAAAAAVVAAKADHFKAFADDLKAMTEAGIETDTAMKTLGDGGNLETAKAAAFETLQEQLAEKDKELAAAKKGAPGFSASDDQHKQTPGDGGNLSAEQQAWNANPQYSNQFHGDFECFAAAFRNGVIEELETAS